MSWLGWMDQYFLLGRWYQFWSGFGGVIERLIELVVIGGILWHRHNCHHRPCWRIARHTLTTRGLTTMYCSKHAEGHRES